MDAASCSKGRIVRRNSLRRVGFLGGLLPLLALLFALMAQDLACQTATVSRSARPLRETGKIYVKGTLLFVNEQQRGIHVIDNSDPSAPEVIAFLDIPGNVDIAIRDNILYADSHYDLVVFDIADPYRATEVTRFGDIFPRPSLRFTSGCFPAGTEILTTSGVRPIETVEPGTELWACDLLSGRWLPAQALKRGVYRYEGDLITIDMDRVRIQATGNHAFYVLDGTDLASRPLPREIPADEGSIVGSGRWVEARDLRAGDVLKSKSAERMTVTAVSSRRVDTDVYSIVVDGYRNFAVHGSGILVHNAGTKEAKAAPTGKGGSLARFTIVGDYLYTLCGSALQLFDITDPAKPAVWKKIQIGWDIETIFPYEDKLFIGGQTGMYVFDNSNPAKPRRLSRFAHVTSCDPVVVEGNYAYVTLRGGTRCGGLDDQLDIIDISDIANPKLVRSHRMSGPYGLGIDQGTLFICDAEEGLKLFDASDPRNLQPLRNFYDIYPIDVILDDQRAIVVGREGLYQYDYRDRQNVKRISVIPVQ
jgi:hypothetical protein